MSDILSFRVHDITIISCLMSADELCPYYAQAETREQRPRLFCVFVRIEGISRGALKCMRVYAKREKQLQGFPCV